MLHYAKSAIAPVALDMRGEPYTPAMRRPWMTEETRARYAEQFEVKPEQVDWVLDNRDAQLAKARERIEYEDPYGLQRGRF